MLFWESKTLWQRIFWLVPWYYCIVFFVSIMGACGLYWWVSMYQPLLVATSALQQQIHSFQQPLLAFSSQESAVSKQEAKISAILAQQGCATSLDILTLVRRVGGNVLQESTKKLERGVGYAYQDSDLVLQVTYQQVTEFSALLATLSNVIIKDFKLDNPRNGTVRCALTVRIITLLEGVV